MYQLHGCGRHKLRKPVVKPEVGQAARRVLEELVGWRGGPIEALARRAKPIW
jgi:hypothetical protein